MYVYLHVYGVYMCAYSYVHLCMCMGTMYVHLCICIYVCVCINLETAVPTATNDKRHFNVLESQN